MTIEELEMYKNLMGKCICITTRENDKICGKWIKNQVNSGTGELRMILNISDKTVGLPIKNIQKIEASLV